jgi:glycosyltransferase involved in cell wall biosynthesis
MKLLITTQIVDRNDPVLGFFHGWISELAQHCESIHVICLKQGEYNFPDTVHVHSLGKESGGNRFMYALRFIRLTFALRHEYDVIFSHMNPHYIVLMGWFWKCFGKRMFLWRNHAVMNLKTWIAAQFALRVFYTSPFACTRRFTHSVQMPVGIDTDLFRPNPKIVATRRSVLFLGRLSPVKRPELFMRSVALLRECAVDVYGDPTPDLGISIDALGTHAKGNARFYGSVANPDTPALYSAHEVYVNLTPEGSMDKTVLEAAACGTLVLVSNTSFTPYVPHACLLAGEAPKNIADAISNILALPEATKEEYRKELRNMVEQHHSLTLLTSRLMEYFKERHD